MRGALVLVLIVLDGPVSGQEKSPLELVRTIPLPGVEGRIDHLALDAKAERLAVAALGNNSVEVVDLPAGKVIHRVDGLREPQGILALDGTFVVASGGDGSCRFYDATSLKLARTVDCKEDADNVRYDARAGLIYVGYGSGALGVVDPKTGVKAGDILLEGHPESFQLEKKGRRVFVNVPGARHIAVGDVEKRAVIATWKLSAQANFPMALDEDARRLWVVCRQPPRVLVFDTESGKETASIACSGDADDVFLDVPSKRAYVSCGSGFLDVFDLAEPRKLAQVPTAAGARTCLLDRGMIYLAVPHRGSQAAEIRVYKTPP